MRRKKYKVTGMSCAACAARVEKAVSGLDGVESCAVNLLTGDMGVEGEVSSAEVVHAVEAAGYGAHPEDDSEAHARPTKDVSEDGREIRSLRARLIASVAFLLPLMYISMGHVMWGWPLFAPLAGDPLALGMLELLLTGAVLLINQRFFVSGTRSLLHGAPNMDTLVALGAAAAFGYSTVVLFGMSGMLVNGDTAGAAHGLHGLYFESAAMILTLITLGKMLEAYAKGRTTDALQSLLALAPETATVLRGEKEQVLPIAEVRRGDIMLIRPGEIFSFWTLVGDPSARRGFRDGLVIAGGKTGSGVGGGMCQFTNLIHWMVLHSDLDIIEHHHHDGMDLFPDYGRQIPFGTGTSIFYNYLDYRFQNDTDRTYQLAVWTDGEYLHGELLADRPQQYSYHIECRNEFFSREEDGVYRNNEIWRHKIDVHTGEETEAVLLRRNHAKLPMIPPV